MSTIHPRPLRRMLTAAAAATTVVFLAGCAGGGGGSGSGDGSFGLLINDDNAVTQDVLTSLSTGACADENEASPLEIETVPQTGLDQQLQLLGGQNALPAQFAASGSPAVTKSLDEAGRTLDLEEALGDLGVLENIEPAALSTIENLYGDLIVLPYQFNIEGVWYNTELFAENGIEVPTTWDEMVAAAGTLQDAGVTAFSASGEQGWPLTRLISGYLYRELGPDAMQAIADGDAQLTDPEYVEGAQAIADLGAAGFFGDGVGSIDYDTAVSQFLTGQAGMFYMGSWTLSAFNDADQNQIGEDSIGFFPLPTVAGGVGTADQIPANVGLPVAVSADSYDDETGAWLSCIAENYGTESLVEQGTVSGFRANGDVGDLPPLTRVVQDTIAETTESTLWFEALFGAKSTLTAQQNAAPLVTGSMSAEDYMAAIQADLDSE